MDLDLPQEILLLDVWMHAVPMAWLRVEEGWERASKAGSWARTGPRGRPCELASLARLDEANKWYRVMKVVSRRSFDPKPEVAP